MSLIQELNTDEQKLLEANSAAFQKDLKKKFAAGNGKICCQHPNCATPTAKLAPYELAIIITPQLLYFAVDKTCAQLESLNKKMKTVKVNN